MNKNRISRNWWNHRAAKDVVFGMISLHLLASLAFNSRFFSWSGVVIFLVLFWVSGGLGIALCYHRLLTHKSIKTHQWFKNLLTTCGCLAWQGSPITWVGTHRHHHNHSDKDLDPHSPLHGFFWAHILWVLTKVPEDFNATDRAKDLKREKTMLWFHQYWWLPQIILMAILFFAGVIFGGLNLGISWVAWGIGVRTVAVFHATWFVNSATHKWGYRNFKDTGDNSRNLWWVALITFGEGWHNNHHEDPNSASHGMRWYEFDITYETIKFLKLIGLVWDVKLPKVKL